MRIFIHSGMHKTGTTTVQQILLKNSKQLESLGYRIFVNCRQLQAKKPDSFDPEWLRHKVKNAEKDGMHSIIFSAEMISTFNLHQTTRLINQFLEHEVNFVICFRHWAGFLPSRWSQNCFRRDTQSFPHYLNNLINNEKEHIESRFDLIVERMISMEPNKIRIISYDNAISTNGLLPTCLSAFDLPQVFIDRFQGDNTRFNVRGDRTSVEVLRLFNGVYSLRNAMEPNGLFVGIMKAIPVQEFYDFQTKMPRIFTENVQLTKQLIHLIRDTESKICLSREDKNFLRWGKALEKISNEFLFNPDQGKLFNSVIETEFVCSEIEISDLDLALQDKMAAALEIA